MKKYNPFSSFDYLVDNLFTYIDKVEVKVFFLYRKKKVITRTLEIPKVKGKDEAYYLKEARRLFRQSIKDGSLNKYCKQHIKQKKRKKVLSVVIPFASACALAGVSFGVYYAITVSQSGGEVITHTLDFEGVDVKMLDDKGQEITDSIVFKEGEVARYKLVAKDDNYDLPPRVDFIDYYNRRITKDCAYDSNTGYFEIKMNQDVIVEAQSYAKDACMVINYDYHDDSYYEDTVGFIIDVDDEAPSSSVTIDWGDGAVTTVHGSDYLDQYSNIYSGEKEKYQIVIKGDVDKIKTFELSNNEIGSYPGSQFLSDVIVLKQFAPDATISFWDNGVPNKAVQRVTFGNQVKHIHEQMFRETALSELYIPKNIETIDEEAFAGDVNLSSVVFENENSKLKEIGNRAFGKVGASNYKLTSITFPSSVEKLGSQTLNIFERLDTITCLAINPPEQNRISYSSYLEHIYVPSESVEAYKNNSGWSFYDDIISAIPSTYEVK